MNNFITESQFRKIVDIARFAPSVHNSQPWKVKYKKNIIEVVVDPQHKLTDGDPTGRQTIISIGIFTQAIALASNSIGIDVSKIEFHKDRSRVFTGKQTGKANHMLKKYILNRSTDRSIYKKIAIDKNTIANISHVETPGDINLHIIDDQNLIEVIAELTSKGISLALTSSAFRSELSEYLVLPWSKKQRGISTDSLYIFKPLSLIEPLLMKVGVGLNSEVNLEKKRWISSSLVVIISSKGDLHEDWFNSGIAYFNVCISLEKLGLSHATSASIVEASTFHEDLESLLDTRNRIQSVIRVGEGVKNRSHSPRVDLNELITSN